MSNFPNPVVRGEKFDFAGLVSQHLINSYEDRHVCLGCHLQNVQREASALLQGSTIPEDKVDFMMWLLFDTPFRRRVALLDHRYAPYLTDEEVVRFWLRFARRANVPLAISSPVWEVVGYTIDLTGKVYYAGSEVIVTSKMNNVGLHQAIGHTVQSLMAAMPDSAFPMKEKEDDSARVVYTDELLRQWRQQDAARQQHYRTLTSTLQNTAKAMAETLERTGVRKDAAVGWILSKTVGWFVWIDSHEVDTAIGEYSNTTYKVADALIISNQGVLYTATGATGRLKTDPQTIINRGKKLTEVKVASDQEFNDFRQKLADFAAKHNLQI
ncbi:MAG TPA: hypothetical protein VNG51_10960 [Ktedonobacteraceae bacterium]|nr:hypothetical protein [Ktedonobacteraceae bacterium]